MFHFAFGVLVPAYTCWAQKLNLLDAKRVTFCLHLLVNHSAHQLHLNSLQKHEVVTPDVQLQECRMTYFALRMSSVISLVKRKARCVAVQLQ